MFVAAAILGGAARQGCASALAGPGIESAPVGNWVWGGLRLTAAAPLSSVVV
jgi:hypothetical protein